jgi:hypothetical protein
MQVETQNASLSTMAVTIKALHVNGKQMTLAVFRQLEQKKENEQAELWGCVHYEIKDQGLIWLVFSQDGHLYRRPLDLTRPKVYEYGVRDAEKNLEKAQDKYNQKKDNVKYHEERMQQSITDMAWDETNKYDSRVERKKYFEFAVSDFKMLFELVEKAQKTLTEEITNYKYELAIEQARLVRETELSKLTHLFIAV